MYNIMGGTFHYVSRANEEEWLRRKQAYSPQEVNLAICLTENSQHIGNIYLRNIDWIARHAELQIWIGETDQRSRGYGYAVQSMLHKYAFDELGLRRLYLFILEGNTSIKLAEKFGFIIEGRLVNHAFSGGKFKDFIVMGLCVDDNS